MTQLDSHEHDIDNKYSFAEFRDILDEYEKRGATHLKLSYQDYGNPIIELFEETEEEQQKIPITFYQIKKVGWGRYCDVTGGNHYAINEGFNPKDSDIFYITEEQAKKLKF
jgi:hypothetical protein